MIPDVRLSYRPASPKVGERVTITAYSLIGLTGVSLTVRQPSGAVLGRSAVVLGRDGEWHTWTYTTDPVSEVGIHEFVFSAADGVEMAGSFDSGASETVGRGVPRVQYDRTYVLLPPDADSSWALAVVDGVWDASRYTVGSSADDAGIGDLDARRVVAVNPSRWPSDLRAFFEEYYPGVEYVPIEATDAQDLRGKLQTLQ